MDYMIGTTTYVTTEQVDNGRHVRCILLYLLGGGHAFVLFTFVAARALTLGLAIIIGLPQRTQFDVANRSQGQQCGCDCCN